MPIRSNTDAAPDLADVTTRRISDFHRMHPEIAIIPAHDRVAFTKVSVAYLPAFPISIKRNESVEELDSETVSSIAATSGRRLGRSRVTV